MSELQTTADQEGPTSLSAVNPQELIQRRESIKETIREVMEPGTHYGKVGGSRQHALRKPGAEVLCSLFNLGAEPADIQKNPLPEIGPEHREYEVDVRIFHIPTGRTVGVGTGVCHTAETKYRWRWDYTDVSPSEEYWETRNEQVLREQVDAEPGQTVETYKQDSGKWVIRVRRPNPEVADEWNTVKKMAKKRALVDGILTVLGVSEFFTQDIDEAHLAPHESAQEETGQGTGQEANGRPGGQERSQNGRQAQVNGRPAQKPAAQETAPANTGPSPENGYVQREDGEGRFERVGPADQDRLRRMDLYLLRASNEVLPDRMEVVRGSFSGQTQTAEYAEHILFCHSERLKETSGYPNEKQVGLLYGLSGDHGWSKQAMERLVKKGWGFASLEAIPSRAVFQEILLQFEDEGLRSVFERDPNTQDLFQDTVDPGQSDRPDQSDGPQEDGGTEPPAPAGDPAIGPEDGPEGGTGGQEQDPGQDLGDMAEGYQEAESGPETAEEAGGMYLNRLPDNLPHVDLIREGGIESLTDLRRKTKDGSLTEVDGIGQARAQEVADHLGVEFDSVDRSVAEDPDWEDGGDLPVGMR